MKLLLKNSTAAALLLGVLVLISNSCQTVEGAGQDIESAGEGLKRAAES
ncbi:entericidin A/B family lipoprotein [bacterium]|nr:entericidin A/B family lipoprotein [bacterium]